MKEGERLHIFYTRSNACEPGAVVRLFSLATLFVFAPRPLIIKVERCVIFCLPGLFVYRQRAVSGNYFEMSILSRREVLFCSIESLYNLNSRMVCIYESNAFAFIFLFGCRF